MGADGSIAREHGAHAPGAGVSPPAADARKRLHDVDAVFSALAHPARRQILLTMHFWGGTMRAGDVAKRFGHSWPTTTRHLKVLVDAGLLSHERAGRTSLYRVRRSRLEVADEWLRWFDRVPDTSNARDRLLRIIGA
jgi:DNA-binding transcriptional ArsR family regulator